MFGADGTQMLFVQVPGAPDLSSGQGVPALQATVQTWKPSAAKLMQFIESQSCSSMQRSYGCLLQAGPSGFASI